ncbi:MAG: hypothetical protein AYP45_03970 [Candidatus Brocadia carolinensis]|uniref:Tyr recombinase domain-containing protein n=1 Tax=Candidatus Brocadia carolinensis TaxID=1004156 RepID=A0A1V4AW99_9BACT|nr:MAG: hypothetical protein AYP45_03970 [Candidatus Brocadia caroliniensis]
MRCFHAVFDKSGIQDFHFHDMRHTFATRVAQQCVDLYKISTLLGHAHISIEHKSPHHCQESLRDGVNILEN